MDIRSINAVVAPSGLGNSPVRHVPPPASPLPDPKPSVEVHVSTEHATSNSYFAIQVDPGTKEIVVKLIDETTGSVIRQIPAEEMLRIAHAISEKLRQHQVYPGEPGA